MQLQLLARVFDPRTVGPRLGLLTVLCLVGSLFATSSLEAQEKRHLRHILVKSEAIADALMKRLDSGSEFKELARRYSLDVGTRPLGGDLDWGVPASYEPEFSRVAFSIAEKGGYAKVQTRHGWHVIEYVDSAPAPQAAPPKPPTQPSPGADSPLPIPTDRNEDIKVEMEWGKSDYVSGEPMRFIISMTNQTSKSIEVFNPELWPLGLLVRYQFGRMNRQLTPPERWGGKLPAGGLKSPLAAGQTLRKQFLLQDYFGEREDWPIIRMIWRGDTLFGRLEKLFPSVVETPEYPRLKGRWRYYISEESRASVLPQYQVKDRWFVCLFARGKIWLEIHDPRIPGLMEDFFTAVRNGDYDDKTITQYVENDHFAVVMETPENPVPFQQPGEGIGWAPGVVGLALDWRDRAAYIGRSLSIALEKPEAISQRAVPIGRVVYVEGDPLGQVTTALDDRKFPTIALALVYPEALLPEEVLEAANALPLPSRFQRKIDPSPKIGWQPMIGKQGEFPKAGKTPGRTPDKQPATVLAKDLPRVEIETDKGTILVELFEDDAPNTVANFISLIEAKTYDGTRVVRKVVTDYNRGFVQMGSPDNTVQGHPGYFIRDEPNVRRHLTGVLSMARHPRRPHTGGSQFFICLDGQPQLDGSYTAFGHVLQGIEIVDLLEEKDAIQKITIVRKRKHAYEPQRLPAN